MAKEKKKKEKVKKEKTPRTGPGFFSRINLPLVLIPILILAGGSFFALGVLKQKAATEAKLAAVDNRVAQKIDELPPPAFKKPPPTLTSGMSAADIQPVVAGQPETSPPSMPEAEAVVQPAPATNPLPTPPGNQVPVTPAPIATAPLTPAPATPVPAGTATPLVKAEAIPPAPAPASKPENGGPIKPMWQTVDQQWDDIIVQPAEQGTEGDTSAAWRSINIGQSDDVNDQVAKSPIMGAALAPKEPPKPEKTPEAVAPPKAIAPKKVRRSTAPSRKTVTRKKRSRVPTVAIVNESGVPQAAQFYRDVLLSFSSSIGVRVGPIQEAPTQIGPTTIFYRAGMETKAKALARRIPGRRTLAPLKGNSEHDILLVVRSR